MQNPFLRLKHYAPPSENHATEVLAACLSLSDNLKREFVLFLFRDKPPFDPAEAGGFEVATQQQLGAYGIVDLLLEQSGIRNIVVEVKVDEKEDGAQIRKYRDWLDKTRSGEKYVFSLVKREGEFDITAFGGDGRGTWWDLYKWFGDRKQEFVEESEIKILGDFHNYLEVEGIVSDWQPKQIVDYGKGIVAQKALRTVFERVEEKLLDLDQGYLTKIFFRDDEWPRLEIGMESWTPIFGSTGYLNKLYIYYETVAAWEGKGEQFHFTIYLWNKWHRSNWERTQSQLRYWVPYLKSKMFEHRTRLTRTRDLESKGADEYTFPEPPLSITARASNPELSYISESEIVSMTSDQLVDEIFRRAIHHCDVISGLPRA
jgi:hypothetical protein